MATTEIAQVHKQQDPRPTTAEERAAKSERTLTSVARKEGLFAQTMLALQTEAFSPENQKVFARRWRIGQAAEMVGISRQMIRLREQEGKLIRPPKRGNNRYADYTLEDINRMRDLFGTRASRGAADEPAIVSFSTFKGGCGKSTLSVHFAQYLAIRGYRVLFIDCDPQGSATTLFGQNPDLPDLLDEPQTNDDEDDEIPLKFTLEEYLARYFSDFGRCIRGSYFPGIDLVPANMDLNGAEYALAADVQQDTGRLNDLRAGIQSVAEGYDVVVLDPPPALGLLSLSVLNAANALVIPMRPTVVDFASTAKFMTMLRQNLGSMIRAGLPVSYNFETLLVNNVDESKSAHQEITDAMKTMFAGEDLLNGMMKDSAEIDNAGKEMMTAYDLTEPTTGYSTYNRCISYLDKVNGEIETRIRRTWPSHQRQLRDEAQI